MVDFMRHCVSLVMILKLKTLTLQVLFFYVAYRVIIAYLSNRWIRQLMCERTGTIPSVTDTTGLFNVFLHYCWLFKLGSCVVRQRIE